MQLRYTFLTLLINFLHLGSSGVNYCGSKMCGLTNSHTFCQYPPGPGPDCNGFIQTGLSDEEKSHILHRLNSRRSAAARGRLRGLPSAGDMLKLHWVDELAREAQLWAYQCRPPATPEEHDQCRDLYAISVGQCVASVVGEAPGLRIESIVDTWYTQGMRYTGDVIAYEPPKSLKGYYGDFAQMIWAHTYMVGCGRSRFVTVHSGRLRSVERLVCNFAPRGPTPARPLWTPAAPAAACPPRAKQDTEFTALCAFQHNLNATDDIDKTMTKEEILMLDTVLEIEKNASLNYIGIIDEIYLTKKAIETMGLPQTNSIQKRDVNDTIIFNSAEVLNESTKNHSLNNLTTSSMNVELKKITPKQKVVIVGRPKSYKIDELNDEGFVKKRENDVESHSEDEPHNTEKDFYDDYNEILESEDNETSVEETTVLKDKRVDVATNINTTNIEATIINDILIENLTEPTQSIVASSNVTEIIDNNEASTNTTEEIKERPIEDYLSDPETVKQIQEELDRMERDLSTDMPAGKVRREVAREEPRGDLERLRENAKPNNTDSTAPMLKMVMKYMPYLKDYQSTLMRSASEKRRSSNLLMFCVVLFLL